MPADMTPRERWMAVLKGEKPDRIPMDYWATPEATERLMAYLGCETEAELYRRLKIDKVLEVGPRYIGPPLADDEDEFGIRYRDVNYGSGVYRECIYHPQPDLLLEEIEAEHEWPSPDWYEDYISREVKPLPRNIPSGAAVQSLFSPIAVYGGQQQAL